MSILKSLRKPLRRLFLDEPADVIVRRSGW